MKTATKKVTFDWDLGKAEAFLEQHKLSEMIQSFLESNEANRIKKQRYSRMIERITWCMQNVPVQEAEEVKKLYDRFSNYEPFNRFADESFKVVIFMSITTAPRFISEYLTENEHLKEAIQGRTETLCRDLAAICNDCIERPIIGIFEDKIRY